MISHKYRCIFIHIPKTAGTSIEKCLGHFTSFEPGVQDHRPLKVIEPLFFKEVIYHVQKRNRSIRSKYKVLRSYFNPPVTHEQYRTYFKFTFIRNPWSRVYSWYKDVMRWEPHQKSLGIKPECTFEEFILDHTDQWALRPQLYWMKNRQGQLDFDFIGRFENLTQDFAYIIDKLGLAERKLPELLVSGNSLYTDFYNEKLIKVIAERYDEEIKLFKFEFGQ